MTVCASSDEEPAPIKPKRILRPLTADQWRLARVQFETGAGDITLERIAAVFNTSLSSVQKRSASEKWSKGSQIVTDARKHLQVATNNALAKAAEKEGEKVAVRLMKELQPWIEEQKRSHIKRAVKRSKRAFKRLDGVADGYEVFDAKSGEIRKLDPSPKDEMHIAAAEDKYDNIIRRNLGMSESSGLSGNLNVQILAGQAAVQISQS